MANATPFYRLVIREHIRKYLGLTAKNKQIFLFKMNDILYISSDVIPKNLKNLKIAKVKLSSRMFLDIPVTYLDYEPMAYTVMNMPGKVLRIEKE